MSELREFIWSQKYRPKTIDECILPENTKKLFNDFIKIGNLPNFLFTGSSGIGKTTAALALCDQIGADTMFINASDENGIDVLRTKIKGFASTISLTDSTKVVILDEADNLNASSTQPAMRAFIEEFSSNCTFIFSVNFKNKIIQPLQSRCSTVDFKIETKDKPKIAKEFFERVKNILQLENVEFDEKVVAEFVQKHFPDFRKTLNELQQFSVAGKLDSWILTNTSSDSYKDLVESLKIKKFNEVRKWVAKNGDSDPQKLFREFYDNSLVYFEPKSIPQLIIILGEYSYRSSFVVDQEINNMAALTEIMNQCEFK